MSDSPHYIVNEFETSFHKTVQNDHLIVTQTFQQNEFPYTDERKKTSHCLDYQIDLFE